MSSLLTRDSFKVAVFFRHGRPHRLAPASIMVVTNFTAGMGRTLHHRGFEFGPVATRSLTPEEQEDAEAAYRYRMVFYADWAALIADEERFLADHPGIGSYFLDRCRRCASKPGYTPHPLSKEREQTLTITEQLEEFIPEELEAPITEQELAAAAKEMKPKPTPQLTLF